MHPRIDYAQAAPGVATAMSALEAYVHQTGLPSGQRVHRPRRSIGLAEQVLLRV